jgi:ABC-type iron transport system FetAB permease component
VTSLQATAWADRLMSRLLFVDMRQQPADPQATTQRAERAFGLSLAFSGLRCILQYVVLPFVLPLLGIAASAATHINFVISLLAVTAVIASLRRFWKVRYHYRWQYLAVALVTLAILATFILMDLGVDIA